MFSFLKEGKKEKKSRKEVKQGTSNMSPEELLRLEEVNICYIVSGDKQCFTIVSLIPGAKITENSWQKEG